MKELDFLPAEYRERDAIQSARLCQVGLVVTFGAAIGLAACFQATLYRAAQLDLTRIARQYDDARAKNTHLAALRGEVEQSRHVAQLYTYLRHPWPRTQMLAEIARNIPPQIALRELTIVAEPAHTKSGDAVIAIGSTGISPPAKADLQQLRRERDTSRGMLQVSGTTTDSNALHLFVMSLNGTPLFESARLHSLEAVPGSPQAESTFLIRLTIRPGFGQPGGPVGPHASMAHGTPQRNVDRS